MIRWFHNLKVAQKLVLISFIFVIPDTIMLYLFITSINENIQFAKLEQTGNQYQRPLEQLLDQVPRRWLQARRASGKELTQRFADGEHDIDTSFVAVAKVDAQIGQSLDFTPEGLAKRNRQGCDVFSVRAEWEKLKADRDGGFAADKRDQQYLQLIDHIRTMIAHLGDTSNLILDPELDSYYLVDVTLMALPQTQDRLSRTMADGEDLLVSKGEAAERRRVTLATDLAFLKADDLDRISSSTQTALTSGNPRFGGPPSFQARVPGALKAYVDAATHFNDLTARILSSDRSSVSLQQYLDAGDAARDASFGLWVVADEELDGILQGRINYYTHRRTRSLGVAACALLASCLLVTFITRSISGPLRKQAIQLSELAQAAESANMAKGEFLARMSHEIRTPLNGVVGMTDLLMDSSLDTKQTLFAQLIKTSALSLAELINDILDFSKIEARKLEIESADFDLYTAVEEITEIMSLKAAQKGIEVACITMPVVPRHVRGDSGRVRQILVNFVANAIKFTESGFVITRVTLEEQQNSTVTVKFSVTDTGIGIPADRMDRLFQSFSQVDVSTTRNYGGTGLGLAISKQLAELMGGAIGVESAIGHGSTFWFTARLELGSSVQEPFPSTGAINPRGLRVLAAHNNSIKRGILREQFCSWGLDAAVASTADEAMKMLIDAAANARPYDVAILDGELPNIDTLELGKAIKARSDIGGTVLLILLPMGSNLEPLKLRAAGFSGHLVKPVRQSRLYDSIVDAMAAASQPQGVVAATSPVAGGSPGHPAAARQRARILVAEDNRVNQIVASEMLAKHGYAHEIVDNGRKAVAAAAAGGYDLILMDCSMPEMDGFEATGQIRRAEQASPANPPRHTPIIALTANAINGDRERCLEAGMDDYVSKPIDANRLIDAIQKQLARSNHAPPTPSAVSVVEPPARQTAAVATANPSTIKGDPTRPLDIDALLDRCMGNAQTARSILELFESEAVSDLEAIKQHVESGDCEATARVAHTLKGASGILSADALSDIAFKLERMGRAGVLAEADWLLSQLNVEVRRCIDYLPTARAAIVKRTEV
jgi:signal transduction histidine kinase/CheY-like chemotaxis protein/HPt (histidine-containing phosphotransfer) domain-containing protein